MNSCEISERNKKIFKRKVNKEIWIYEKALFIALVTAFFILFVFWYGFQALFIALYISTFFEMIIYLTKTSKLRASLYGLNDMEIYFDDNKNLIIVSKIRTKIGDMYKTRFVRPENMVIKGNYIEVKGQSNYTLVDKKENIYFSKVENPNNEKVYIPRITKTCYQNLKNE